jgi:hypothetical protein
MLRVDLQWACGHSGHSQIDETSEITPAEETAATFRARDGCKSLKCWLCRSREIDNNTNVIWPEGSALA